MANLLFARRIIIVVLSQRDITTAYDEGHAYFIVSEVLGTLKKEAVPNIITAVTARLDYGSGLSIIVLVQCSSSILVQTVTWLLQLW